VDAEDSLMYESDDETAQSIREIELLGA